MRKIATKVVEEVARTVGYTVMAKTTEMGVEELLKCLSSGFGSEEEPPQPTAEDVRQTTPLAVSVSTSGAITLSTQISPSPVQIQVQVEDKEKLKLAAVLAAGGACGAVVAWGAISMLKKAGSGGRGSHD